MLPFERGWRTFTAPSCHPARKLQAYVHATTHGRPGLGGWAKATPARCCCPSASRAQLLLLHCLCSGGGASGTWGGAAGARDSHTKTGSRSVAAPGGVQRRNGATRPVAGRLSAWGGIQRAWRPKVAATALLMSDVATGASSGSPVAQEVCADWFCLCFSQEPNKRHQMVAR